MKASIKWREPKKATGRLSDVALLLARPVRRTRLLVTTFGQATTVPIDREVISYELVTNSVDRVFRPTCYI